MTRDAALFRAVGAALYGGSHWHAQMAEALEVSDRTIRRWSAGKFSIPEPVWHELAAICCERGKTLTQIAADLQSLPTHAESL